jgi:hypothetical protein
MARLAANVGSSDGTVWARHGSNGGDWRVLATTVPVTTQLAWTGSRGRVWTVLCWNDKEGVAAVDRPTRVLDCPG